MNLRNKLAIVGLTGAVFTGGVFGLSGLASAQTPAADEGSTEQELIAPDEGYEVSEFDQFSDEDKELILNFEQCITDAGLEGIAEGEHDESAVAVEGEDELGHIDEIFETCEAGLEGLSFDADDWLEPELSPEDEAAFERYDECIENIDGFSFDEDADWTDEDFEKFEAAVVECDSLLEGVEFAMATELLEDGDWAEMEEGHWEDGEFETFDLDLSDEDQAVFDAFDQCISDTFAETGGIDLEDEAELTDEDFEALDGALEDCESILEGLSEDAQVLFDCEEGEEGEYGEAHEEDLEGENVETLLSA